jgi:hypothetical protein
MDAEQLAQAVAESFVGMLLKGIWKQAMFGQTRCEHLCYPDPSSPVVNLHLQLRHLQPYEFRVDWPRILSSNGRNLV